MRGECEGTWGALGGAVTVAGPSDGVGVAGAPDSAPPAVGKKNETRHDTVGFCWIEGEKIRNDVEVRV